MSATPAGDAWQSNISVQIQVWINGATGNISEFNGDYHLNLRERGMKSCRWELPFAPRQQLHRAVFVANQTKNGTFEVWFKFEGDIEGPEWTALSICDLSNAILLKLNPDFPADKAVANGWPQHIRVSFSNLDTAQKSFYIAPELSVGAMAMLSSLGDLGSSGSPSSSSAPPPSSSSSVPPPSSSSSVHSSSSSSASHSTSSSPHSSSSAPHSSSSTSSSSTSSSSTSSSSTSNSSSTGGSSSSSAGCPAVQSVSVSSGGSKYTNYPNAQHTNFRANAKTQTGISLTASLVSPGKCNEISWSVSTNGSITSSGCNAIIDPLSSTNGSIVTYTITCVATGAVLWSGTVVFRYIKSPTGGSGGGGSGRQPVIWGRNASGGLRVRPPRVPSTPAPLAFPRLPNEEIPCCDQEDSCCLEDGTCD